MGTIPVNLQGVEAWTPATMLGPGKHLVRIDNATDTASQSGAPQVELQMMAVDDSGGIRDWLSFSEAALGRAVMVLQAAGVEVPQNGGNFPTERLTGKTLWIYVQEKPDRQGAVDNNGNPLMRREVVGYEAHSGAVGGNSNAGSSSIPVTAEDIPF